MEPALIVFGIVVVGFAALCYLAVRGIGRSVEKAEKEEEALLAAENPDGSPSTLYFPDHVKVILPAEPEEK
jgi:hypothetical protein